MIVDKFVAILFGIINGVLSLFPAWQLPFDMPALAADMATGVSRLNAFFPVSTLGACIGAVIGLKLVMFVWDIAVWVYDKIPFKMS